MYREVAGIHPGTDELILERMRILLSPAKSLNLERSRPEMVRTEPLFLGESQSVHRVLAKKNPRSLMKLQGISQGLAQLNWERNQAFVDPQRAQAPLPAVYVFDGDVYQGLDMDSFPEPFLDRMQEQLRILSGLYGWLRPFDGILPYRLEMGTPLRVGTRKDLYAYWGKRLTGQLNEEESEWVVNLASQEYFRVLDRKKLKARVISPQFRDFHQGTYRVISFHAKKARGAMARYLLTSEASGPEVIRSFGGMGYGYSEALTTDPDQPVFVR